MMKLGTPERVDGPGSASTKPGLVGVGEPSGRRSGFRRRCFRRLTSGRAVSPPVSFRSFFFLWVRFFCGVLGPCVLGCWWPPCEVGGGGAVVVGGGSLGGSFGFEG